MSEDKQRPIAPTFEEAFRDVQPRPDLEATLMARYPELQVEFASSPTFFDADGVDANWMTETIQKVFPNFQSVVGMDHILHISLASLIHHQEKVMAFDANHIARSIPIF